MGTYNDTTQKVKQQKINNIGKKMKKNILMILMIVSIIAIGAYRISDVPNGLIESIVKPQNGHYFISQRDGIDFRQYMGTVSIEHYAPIDSSATSINTLNKVYIFIDEKMYDITDFVKGKYVE
jgi:hypothetical protein